MRKTTIFGLIGLGVLAILGTSGESALGAGADGEAPEAAQTCRKAEVNPVTGHVFCFDPIGAPVAAPPQAAEVPCKAEAHTGEAWSWSPKCKPEDAAKPAPGAEG
jgi:hypothetical protein